MKIFWEMKLEPFQIFDQFPDCFLLIAKIRVTNKFKWVFGRLSFCPFPSITFSILKKTLGKNIENRVTYFTLSSNPKLMSQ